jgi:hypothetical protein
MRSRFTQPHASHDLRTHPQCSEIVNAVKVASGLWMSLVYWLVFVSMMLLAMQVLQYSLSALYSLSTSY